LYSPASKNLHNTGSQPDLFDEHVGADKIGSAWLSECTRSVMRALARCHGWCDRASAWSR
jgi:hypothetical protein